MKNKKKVKWSTTGLQTTCPRYWVAPSYSRVNLRMFETLQHWPRMLKIYFQSRSHNDTFLGFIIIIRFIQIVVRWSRGRVWEACSPAWPLSDQRGGDKWLQHSSLSAVGGGSSGPPTVSYIILTTLFFSCGLSIEALCDWHGDPLRLIGSLNCVTAREAEQTLSPL